MRKLIVLAAIVSVAIGIPVIVRTQTAMFQFGDARADHAWFQFTDPVNQPNLVGAFFDGTTFELNSTVPIATVAGADTDVNTVFRSHGAGIKGEIAKVINASLSTSGQSIRVECVSGVSIGQLRDGYRQLPLRDGAQVVVNTFSVDSVTVHAADQNGNNVNAAINVDALVSAVRGLVSHNAFPVANAPNAVSSPSVSAATSPPSTCPDTSSTNVKPTKAALEAAQVQPASQNGNVTSTSGPQPSASPNSVSSSSPAAPASPAPDGAQVVVSVGAQANSATIRDLRATHVVTALRIAEVRQDSRPRTHSISFSNANPFQATNVDTNPPSYRLAITDVPRESAGANYGRTCVRITLTNLNDSVIGAPNDASVLTCPSNFVFVPDPSGIPAPSFVPTPSPVFQNNQLDQISLRKVAQKDALTSIVSRCSIDISGLRFAFRPARPNEMPGAPVDAVAFNSVSGNATVTEIPYRVTLTTKYRFH
jgi:hypothetical protein